MILRNPRLLLYSSAAANSALEFVLALQVAPLPFFFSFLKKKERFFRMYVVKQATDSREFGATRVRARAAPPSRSHLFTTAFLLLLFTAAFYYCFLLLLFTTSFHY